MEMSAKQQKNARNRVVTDLNKAQIDAITKYISLQFKGEDGKVKLTFDKKTAYDLLQSYFINTRGKLAVDHFLECFLKSKSLQQLKNKLWNVINPRMTVPEYIKQLMSKFKEILPKTKLGKSKDRILKNALKSTEFFELYFVGTFNYIDKENYYVFIPVLWTFLDKDDNNISFTVPVDNFSFTVGKKYFKIDEELSFEVEGKSYYFSAFRLSENTQTKLPYIKPIPIIDGAIDWFKEVSNTVTTADSPAEEFNLIMQYDLFVAKTEEPRAITEYVKLDDYADIMKMMESDEADDEAADDEEVEEEVEEEEEEEVSEDN